jgi:hypothetical protein
MPKQVVASRLATGASVSERWQVVGVGPDNQENADNGRNAGSEPAGPTYLTRNVRLAEA